MKIYFDRAFDGRIWPNWSSKKTGTFGIAWVGPLGLLDILETLLGLKRPIMPDSIRAARIVPELEKNRGAFWAKSFKEDPLGVAKKLLEMRDSLLMHGWQYQPLTDRLADLASISKLTESGIPDRLIAVSEKLDKFYEDLPEITVFEPFDTLPPLWKKIFDQITEKSGSIFHQDTDPIPATGDLDHAKGEHFSPVFDGSLQLVRPEGKLQAAEDIAAWLAAVNREQGLDGVVIIGGDAVLDNALRQHGLPTLGTDSSRYNHSFLELLPLVLAMGWNPPDPSRAMELLSLSASPVPKSIDNLLVKALDSWPAVGSPDWEESIAKGLANISDDEQRGKVQTRLDILFHPDARDGSYQVQAIENRVEMLNAWLRGRFRDDPLAMDAIAQSQTLLAMIDAMQLYEISDPILRKLLEEATVNNNASSYPSQAGIGSVASPEALIDEAKITIWWSFSRGDAPSIEKTYFYEHEHKALQAEGIALSDPGEQAMLDANKWQRPLLLTSERLILVCPKVDDLGEELHPHPLWDELLAASKNEAEKLITEAPKTDVTPEKYTPALKALPVPEKEWEVAHGSIVPREYESPSSVQTFLGCPFKWVLQYIAKIKNNTVGTLPDLDKILGKMAHEIIEEVLLQDPLPLPEQGAKLSEELFYKRGPVLVAEFFQKGRDVDREMAKNTLIMATKSLLQYFHEAGCKKIEVEKELETECFNGQKFTGRADIVVDDPFTVIDLKKSWAKGFREKLAKGTTLQLAAYAKMLKPQKGIYPELAYYILQDQSLITTNPFHFNHADVVDSPEIDIIWTAIEKSFEHYWGLLKKGKIECPGKEEEIESRVEKGRLTLEPPCRFCDYEVLCGNKFAGDSI